ncbi:hypothetical protein [Halalkalibacter sp. APA_J-10(15)]|uniref:hypothetical protein n=1 Tax=Halalkalibacter sp. APA_J-10(15) TaxID=2933805 RepID=UPI001FF32F05|nr:hypothetical protein [Halalkalibacter sp. APA_J-10(15)]MCK0470243.1 hypothetical protein [Halalkalibacter sp. APA_J-10(15)]
MKKLLVHVGFLFLLSGCFSSDSTMSLLDEEVIAIGISESKGFGGINEDILILIDEQDELDTLMHIIETARKENEIKMTDVQPEFDLLIEYSEVDGTFPTHGLHVIIGMDGEKSILYYIGDETAYVTSEEDTSVMREMLLND